MEECCKMFKVNFHSLFLLTVLFLNNPNMFCSSFRQPEQNSFPSVYQHPESSVSVPSSFPISGSITLQPYNWPFNSSANTFIFPVWDPNSATNMLDSINASSLSMRHDGEHFNDAFANRNSNSPLLIPDESIPSNTIDTSSHTNNNPISSTALHTQLPEVANHTNYPPATVQSEQSSSPSTYHHPENSVDIRPLFPIGSSVTPQPHNCPFNSSTHTFIPLDWNPNSSTNTFANIHNPSLCIPDDLIPSNSIDISATTNSNPITSVVPHIPLQEVARMNEDKDHALSEKKKGKKAKKKSKQEKHPKKNFTCPTCQKSFLSNNGLKYHIETHNPNRGRPYHCHLCPKRFTAKHILKNHIKRHSKEKSFLCDYCSMSFKTKPEKIRHHRIHTGERPFKCDFCNKRFKANTNKTRHQRIHTSEKPFKCYICHKGLSSKVVLEGHLKGHKGEKPYKCNQCTKAYSLKTSLIKHKKTHNRHKVYTCYYCGSAFASQSEYDNHVRYEESTDEDLKCHHCKKVYANKYNLKEHNETVHRGT